VTEAATRNSVASFILELWKDMEVEKAEFRDALV